MNEKLDLGMQLSQDEKGQLHGGYELQESSSQDSQFFSDNGNCKGGG